MKVLLDQNLPRRLLPCFESRCEGAQHVKDLGLDTASDGEILEFAIEDGFSILSKDRDFADWVLLNGAPSKVVWIRSGNCSTDDLVRVLEESWPDIASFHEDLDLALLVVPLSLAIG